MKSEVMSVILTIEQLKERIAPVALKYRLPAVYIFGSYANGKATDKSDVDVLVDIKGSIVKGWIIGGLYNDLCENVGKEVDLITIGALEQESTKQRTPWFIDNVRKDIVQIYEQG
jgi:predicted nucleotidyltransferase